MLFILTYDVLTCDWRSNRAPQVLVLAQIDCVTSEYSCIYNIVVRIYPCTILCVKGTLVYTDPDGKPALSPSGTLVEHGSQSRTLSVTSATTLGS